MRSLQLSPAQEQEIRSLERKWKKDRDPRLWRSQALLALGRGKSQKEIARSLGKSAPRISELKSGFIEQGMPFLTRQSVGRNRIIREGEEEVALEEIRTTKETSPSRPPIRSRILNGKQQYFVKGRWVSQRTLSRIISRAGLICKGGYKLTKRTEPEPLAIRAWIPPDIDEDFYGPRFHRFEDETP